MFNIRAALCLVAWAGLFCFAQAEVHNIITANRHVPEKIHAIEFDDQTSTLRHVQSSDASNTHVWLSLSHDRRTVYGSSLENGRLSSYNAVTLRTTGEIEHFGDCEGKNSAYNFMNTREPFYVFSGSYTKTGGCGVSMILSSDGSLHNGAQSWPLEPESSTHGLEFLAINGNEFLYTADMGTDTIWTHSIDKSGGVTEVGRLRLSTRGVKPRFLEIHPNGRYMYVILEHDNSVASLRIGSLGEVSEDEDQAPYSLIPEDADGEQYWSAVLALSPNNRYLWASSRGRGINTGYISCFLLDKEGTLMKKMFMIPTGTSGTTTSSLTVAPWSNEHVIYGDAPAGFIEVLKLQGPLETDCGVEYSTAKVIARLDIAPGVCCSNALWLN